MNDDLQQPMAMSDLNALKFRGLVNLAMGSGTQRMAVMWQRDGYENLRAAIYDAVCFFEDQTNIRADYVLVRSLPKKIENGFEVGNVIILQADWIAPKYICVCARERGL